MAAKKKSIAPGKANYDAMCEAKVKAGLSLADAIEVTQRQCEEDAANGVTIDIEEPEPTPGA